MENIDRCEYYDEELDCCKYFSDWSDAMPILQPCVESPCEKYRPREVGEKCPVEQCPYFTQDIDYYRVLKQIKIEVAREIFEEIERILSLNYCCCLPQGATEHYEYYEGDVAKDIAELKKKYI